MILLLVSCTNNEHENVSKHDSLFSAPTKIAVNKTEGYGINLICLFT